MSAPMAIPALLLPIGAVIVTLIVLGIFGFILFRVLCNQGILPGFLCGEKTPAEKIKEAAEKVSEAIATPANCQIFPNTPGCRKLREETEKKCRTASNNFNTFLDSEGKCRTCPKGYTRSRFPENGPKACKNVTASIEAEEVPAFHFKKGTLLSKKEQRKTIGGNLAPIGSIGQSLGDTVKVTCKKQFGLDASMSVTGDCYKCPAGYIKRPGIAWGSGNECRIKGDLLKSCVIPGNFQKLNKCYRCPTGFKENTGITNLADLQSRGCIGIGTGGEPFKPASFLNEAFTMTLPDPKDTRLF